MTATARPRLQRASGESRVAFAVRDGATRLAMTGWVDALDLAPSGAPSPRELPRSYPDNTRMDIAEVFAPYRSQLDGSPYSLANCGPTVVSMALAAFGIDAAGIHTNADRAVVVTRDLC